MDNTEDFWLLLKEATFFLAGFTDILFMGHFFRNKRFFLLLWYFVARILIQNLFNEIFCLFFRFFLIVLISFLLFFFFNIRLCYLLLLWDDNGEPIIILSSWVGLFFFFDLLRLGFNFLLRISFWGGNRSLLFCLNATLLWFNCGLVRMFCCFNSFSRLLHWLINRRMRLCRNLTRRRIKKGVLVACIYLGITIKV